MVLDEQQPFLVQAIYSFKGKNNDELCFKKGDIITVTQLEEGGWWEGTLGEKTGWFPSNYVKEYKVQSDNLSPVKTCDIVAQQRAYRSLVLKDFIDSERVHVNELQQLIQHIIVPIEKSHLLTKEECAALVNNVREVVNLHENILCGVESAVTKSPSEQRVGKLMLGMAPRFKQIHYTYCSLHPHAAFIVNKHKEKLTTLFQSEGITLLTLTTGLSKPFRRVEKYTNHLQELERHLEESHPDRGDTQRAVSVYKDIANACSVVRRQKEMEVEIMNGGVRGWEGQDISKMGEIIHMGSVAVGPEHRDRYLVLFPSTLLMLSASHRMSAFIYEGKLPLTGITVNKLEDTENYKNAFEVVGHLIERILAICQTKEDQQRWVDLIKEQCDKFGAKASPLALHKKRENVMIDHSTNGPWSMTRLRPSTPARLLKQNDLERDAQILRVIESYCTSASSRFTLNSAAEKIRRAESPQPFVQRKPRPRRASTWCCDELDSKSIDNCVNASKNIEIETKDLSGTVHQLHERILQLQNELESLKTDVKVEKTAREQLEAFVQNNQCPITPKEEANGS